jgi:hypothetical protein
VFHDVPKSSKWFQSHLVNGYDFYDKEGVWTQGGGWVLGCSMTFGYRFFLGTNHIPLPFQLFQEVSRPSGNSIFFTEKWISASVVSTFSLSPPVGSKGVPETFHNRNIVMRKNSKVVARGHSLTLSYVKVNHSNVNLNLI